MRSILPMIAVPLAVAAVLAVCSCRGGVDIEPSVGVEAGVGGDNVVHAKVTGPRVTARGDGFSVGVEHTADPNARKAIADADASAKSTTTALWFVFGGVVLLVLVLLGFLLAALFRRKS